MTTISEAAVGYFKRGWAPLPIKAESKAPEGSAWQKTAYTSQEEVEKAFVEAANVGLLLGTPSNGLVDVDLDAPEARAVATALLPETGMVSGRPGSPRSHFWYVVPDAQGRQSFTHRGSGDTLVELRGTGGQTVVPPSTHVSGEPIRWEESGDPATSTWEELRKAVRTVAASAILVRAWKDGIRHDLAMAVAGSCLRNGWTPDDVESLVATIADAAGDPEVSDRVQAVRTTAERLDADREVSGLPTLAKLIGEDDATKVSELLGLRKSKPAPTAGPDVLPLTDLGNGERFARDHAGKVVYTRTHGWLVWDGTRWAEDDTGHVRRLAAVSARTPRRSATRRSGRAAREPRP